MRPTPRDGQPPDVLPGAREEGAEDQERVRPVGRAAWIDPTSKIGAFLYNFSAGLLLWLLLEIGSHIEINWH
ncbi:hypothetical protein [Actinomadura terrae]|uniref:hypothetical protein n=1 Tax=Actinomadura terrae TaxID=604353 RepID=UPI001FA6BDFA|nr:hypothetical protein [Actinomadura terrae]